MFCKGKRKEREDRIVEKDEYIMTVEDCIKMYERENKFVCIQDGKVKGIYKNKIDKVIRQRENDKNLMEGDEEA